MAIVNNLSYSNGTSGGITTSDCEDDVDIETTFNHDNKSTLIRYNSTHSCTTTTMSDVQDEKRNDDDDTSSKNDENNDDGESECEEAEEAFQRNKVLRFKTCENNENENDNDASEGARTKATTATTTTTNDLSTVSSTSSPPRSGNITDNTSQRPNLGMSSSLKQSKRFLMDSAPASQNDNSSNTTANHRPSVRFADDRENKKNDSSTGETSTKKSKSPLSPSKKSRKSRPKLKKHSFTDEVMSNSFRMNEGDSSILDSLHDNFDLEEMRKELEEFDTRTFVVKFDHVDVYMMARRLGENPSVRFGAPIALGDECISTKTLSIDEFENAKPPQPRKRRRKVPMLTGPQRLQMLKELGYQPSDIIKAAIKAAEDRERRTKAAGMFIHEYGKANILNYSANEEPDDEVKQTETCCGWI